ncbi:MAG: hypothetical protein DI585_00100 [Pseudomonas fluorescens]|nr:MAG: hypothetical protein DI585_00100 [Pseudomonas fluorescens]
MKKDFDRLFDSGWVNDAGENSGIYDIFPTASRKERLAEQQICLHKNGQNRVVTQDGVSDQLAYRRCALSPYAMDGGSRMGIRPDGVGSVVR